MVRKRDQRVLRKPPPVRQKIDKISKKPPKRKVIKKSAFAAYLTDSKRAKESSNSQNSKTKIFSKPSLGPTERRLPAYQQIQDNISVTVSNEKPDIYTRMLQVAEPLLSAPQRNAQIITRTRTAESYTDAELAGPIDLTYVSDTLVDTSEPMTEDSLDPLGESISDTHVDTSEPIAGDSLDPLESNVSAPDPESLQEEDEEDSDDEVGIFSLSTDRKSVLLGISKEAKIFGYGRIKVVKGSVEVLGAILTPQSSELEFYAPIADCAVVIEPITKNGPENISNSWDVLKSVPNTIPENMPREPIEEFTKGYTHVILFSSLEPLHFPGYPDIFKPKQNIVMLHLNAGACLTRIKRCFQRFPSCITTCDEILSDNLQHSSMTEHLPVIVTVGGKGTGKSTFNRFLMNKMLQNYPGVNYVDCDIGQPEFTPPGFISVTHVKSPLVGPPFTHLQNPAYAVYYGRVNCAGQPDYYIQIVEEVLKHLDNTCPVVVNTMGWARGLGMSILVDIIRMVRPTHLVQISGARESRNLPMITNNYVRCSDGWIIDASLEIPNFQHLVVKTDIKKTYEVLGYSPSDLRNLRLLGYLSKIQNFCSERDFGTSDGTKLSLRGLSSTKPYKVYISDVALCICHESGIRKCFALPLFNASLVGLCVVSKRFVQECKTKEYLCAPPVSECFGIGVVRGVDVERQCLYVISHLPKDTLKRINCLSLGSLSIPECMYDLDESQSSNAAGEELVPPYVSLNFPFHVTGSGKFRVYRSK